MIKKITLALIALIFIAAGVFFIIIKTRPNSRTVRTIENVPNIVKDNVQSEVQNISDNLGTNKNNSTIDQTTGLPKKITINVPFTSQAPFGVWDQYHEEACEEASLIMLKYYLDRKSLTPQTAEQEIQSMIAFEIKNYGDYKDTSAAQNVKLFYDFYGAPANGKNLKVIYDFPKEDLKKYLAQDNPVIVPAAGRLLGNPYYTPPGPIYHNLVLIGYDGNTIIANDPGTKRGQGYKYSIDALYNAIHDFPGSLDQMDQGRKAMIVIE